MDSGVSPVAPDQVARAYRDIVLVGGPWPGDILGLAHLPHKCKQLF